MRAHLVKNVIPRDGGTERSVHSVRERVAVVCCILARSLMSGTRVRFRGG